MRRLRRPYRATPGEYKVRRTRQRRHIALGETFDGQLAFVVFRRLPGGLVRVVAARDMEASERRMFRRKYVNHMKRQPPQAKAPLPKFNSDESAAEYFETHSVAEVWNQLPEGKSAGPSKALAKSIRERHTAAKSPISIRLGSDQIAAAKKIAATKSVGLSDAVADVDSRGDSPRGKAGVILWPQPEPTGRGV